MEVCVKVLWILFENICFAIGLFCLIFLLTSFLNEHNISVIRDGEQIFCFSQDFKQTCIPHKEK